jgi:hypothetical protein
MAVDFYVRSGYVIYSAHGTDRSGKYQVFVHDSTVVFTSDFKTFYSSGPETFGCLMNKPAFHGGGRLMFDPGDMEGTRMLEFSPGAQLTSVKKGLWSVWIVHLDGSKEVVKIQLDDVPMRVSQ